MLTLNFGLENVVLYENIFSCWLRQEPKVWQSLFVRHFSLDHLHLSGSDLLSHPSLPSFLGGIGKTEPKILRLVIRLT